MRNILIISYFAPPYNMPSAVRTGKFAKNLSELGWNPIIITVKDIGFYFKDDTLLKELSHIEIIRTESLDPQRVLGKLNKQKETNLSKKLYKEKEGFTKKIQSLFPIDDKIGWMPFCYKAAVKIIKKQKIDAIYTYVGGINHPAITVYDLSKKFRIPFFVEFHDLWANHPFFDRTKIGQKFNDMWEKKVVKAASGVIALAPGQKALLQNKYNFLKGKIIFNPNGFDAENAMKSYQPDNKLTFTFCGSLYKNMSAKDIFNVLTECKDIEIPIKLKFIGNFRNSFYNMKNRFVETITNRDIEVEMLPRMDYKQLMQELRQSDVLMLFLPNEEKFKPILHAKLYDYIAVGKPILAFVPKESDVWNFVQDNNLGYVVESGNLESAKITMKKLVAEYKNNDLKKYQAKQHFIAKYSRTNAIKEVAKFIEENI